MKIFLERAVFINRAPFERLDLSFEENEIVVLTSVNGKGKTTIISYIVDSIYELARPHFPNEFADRPNKLYRVSAPGFNLNAELPAFLYLRFKTEIGNVDYLDVRNICTEDEYNREIVLEDKIQFNEFSVELGQQRFVKKVSANLGADQAKQLFNENILTYFPSYRYERPGYLNDPYQIQIDFRKENMFIGYLRNPIEVVTALPQLANWLMDIALDATLYPNQSVNNLLQSVGIVINQMLASKGYGNVRLGIGQRGLGATRLQIIKTADNTPVYPNIFNLSSGELAVLCLFVELLRQGDRIHYEFSLPQITGVVLIDEIEKHLHIKLQKEILPLLFNLFPNVQFILSSHSPFLGMGLAELAAERSKLVDLDKFGVSNDPTTNDLYTEVYNMMVGENDRFKEMYEAITNQFEAGKKLQVVTEGKNTEHIEKALQILDPGILAEIQIIRGCEHQSGAQQLKNAFDVMSKANHVNPFLFVWDCDSAGTAANVVETSNFSKFSFERNDQNKIATKGIENLYPQELFDDDLYDTKETPIDYGGKDTKILFSKSKFLEKVKALTTKDEFQNFTPLLNRIKKIIAARDIVAKEALAEPVAG